MTRLVRACACVAVLSGCPAKQGEPPAPAAAAAPPKQAPPAPVFTPKPAVQVPAPADVAAAPATAKKLDDGIAFEILTPGTGTEHPKATESANVNFTLWSTDGKMFDTTQGKGPTVFPLAAIPPGWGEALQQLVAGEKARFWIPAELGFHGNPALSGVNVIEFELVDIKKPPTVPPDVKAPPADARTLPDGLAIKVLKPGTGTVHPKVTDRVTVHYSGWTTDGNMFDSSVARGTPATFPLLQLIPGWKEGIPLMVEGETSRMWIPEVLAYAGQPGKPAGMLVFDIELIKIEAPGQGGAPH